MDHRTRSQAGNVFFTLFGAVGLVGVLGASTMTILKGPVKSMAEVTKRTIAENNMIASGKLALMAASNQADDGDCDADSRIEPLPFNSSGSGAKPTGGGYLPSSIGASLQDPWGNTYGYCVWDHGSNAGVGGDNDANCGGSSNFLAGADTEDKIVLAVLSSGPNRAYEVTCGANPAYVTRPAGSDDVVLSFTYAEAKSMSGGVWNIEEGDITTAEIKKNLSVKDDGGVEQLAFDTATKAFSIGTGGVGSFPTVKTDFIQQLTGGSVEFLSNIELGSTWISGDGGNEGIQVAANGTVSTSGALTAGGIVSGSALSTAGTLGVTGTSTLGAVNAGATSVTTLGTSGPFTAGANIALGSNHISSTGAAGTGLSVNSTGTVITSGTSASFSMNPRDGSGDHWAIYNPTGDDFRIYRLTGGDAVTILQNGNVGIGTTAPSNPLTVASGSGQWATGIVVMPSTHASSERAAITLDNWSWLQDSNGNGTKDFTLWQGSAGAHRIYVNTSGNVGVGSTNPTSKLTVGGEVDVTSNKIINLATPISNGDAANKAYVDTAVAAGTGFVEQDPQVGTVTVSGKVCQADGSKIECNIDSSSLGGDNLGNHTATQNLAMATYDVSNVSDVTFSGVTGTAPLVNGDTLGSLSCSNGQYAQWNGSAWVCAAGGSDNLGNHTATTNVQLGANWLSSDGGGEGIRVDASGNVSVGTAPTAAKLYVAGNYSGGSAFRADGSAGRAIIDYTGNGANYFDGADHYFRTYAGANMLTLNTSAATFVPSVVAPSFYSNSTYAYVGADSNDFIRFQNSGDHYWQMNGTWEYYISATAFSPYANNANDLGTSGYRWKDGYFAGSVGAGSIEVGGTWSSNAARAYLNSTGYIWSSTNSTEWNQYLHRNSTTNGFVVFGWSTSGTIGSIQTNGSSVTYNTTSDYRLKENIQPLDGALEAIDLLKPSKFSFKADEKHTIVDGFIAHEVQKVAPYAVTGEKDAVDKDGKPVMQQMDYGKLTPLLTAGVKELKTVVEIENEALKSQIDALEERLELLESATKTTEAH
jgi:hypothetical protein